MSGLIIESQGDISFSDCEPRCILFIKKRSLITTNNLSRSDLPSNWLCHPALVVESIEPDQVLICPLTSFNSRTLRERFPRQNHEWIKYFPVEPHVQVVRSRPQLRLDGAELNKPSYINVDKIYNVHFSMLQAYDGTYPPNHVRLSEESFQQVLKVLRLGWRPFVTPTSSALGSPNTPFHEELQRTAEDTPTRIQHRSFSSEHSPLLPLYEQGTRLSTRGRIVSRPSTPSIFRQSRNDQSSKSSQILIVILLLISYICILYGGYHLGKLLSRPL